jgi:glucuronate isomerase
MCSRIVICYVPDHYIDEERSMSSQWDPEEVHGEWISKEVYFKDGWPSVMRDPIKEWVSLTMEDMAELRRSGLHEISDKHFQAIEAKLREKNT